MGKIRWSTVLVVVGTAANVGAFVFMVWAHYYPTAQSRHNRRLLPRHNSPSRVLTGELAVTHRIPWGTVGLIAGGLLNLTALLFGARKRESPRLIG